MTHIYDADEYAFIISEYPLAKYVYTPYIKQWLASRPPCSLLDLGCGEGHFTRIAKKSGVDLVTSIDKQPALLNKAIALEKKTPLGIDYQFGDATTLRLEQNFSIVWAFWLTCTLSSKEQLNAMAETLYYHTLPGGKSLLLIEDLSHQAAQMVDYSQYGKNIEALSDLKEGSAFKMSLHSEGHSIHFTNYVWYPHTVADILQSTGFSKVAQVPIGVSDQGIEAMGNPFWQPYMEHPFIVMLEAEKPE